MLKDPQEYKDPPDGLVQLAELDSRETLEAPAPPDPREIPDTLV